MWGGMRRRSLHGSLAVRVGLTACAAAVCLAARQAADPAPKEHPADTIDRKALKARQTWWSWKPLAAPESLAT